MSKIYKQYKRRLIEISGNNRSLFTKKITNKFSYDLGKLYQNDQKKIDEFVDFLWSSSRLSFELVGKDEKALVYQNLDVEKKLSKYKTTYLDENGEQKIDHLKLERIRKQETKNMILHEVASLKTLKRELEEYDKETGRYELYVGYPFVEGYVGKDLAIRAPLILFPVTINIENESTANLEFKVGSQICLNKVLIYAYASHKKLNVDELETDYDTLKSSGFDNVSDVLGYLSKFGINFEFDKNKNLLPFEDLRELKMGDKLQIKNYCVLGRFPLTNSIYNDYEILEKKHLSTDAIDELLFAKQVKKSAKQNANLYTVSHLDYAQQKAIENLNKNANMVIYGPPGTGKSQTIVNILTDAIVKDKKVLVVSQKKAALEVVFNRLGNLNVKAILISDGDKAKAEFYQKAKQQHDQMMLQLSTVSEQKFVDLEDKIQAETKNLQTINDILFTKLPYGLSLQEMYANCEIIGQKSSDYVLYKDLQKNQMLMSLDYFTLSEALRKIAEKKKDDLYFKFLEKKQINPLIDYIKSDIDIHTLTQAQNTIKMAISNKFVPFDMTKRPYSRDLLAYYLEHSDGKEIEYKPLTKFIATTQYPKLYKNLKASYLFLPLYPFAKSKTKKVEKQIESSFDSTLADLKNYIKDFEILSKVLEPKGYLLTLDNILSGNTMYLKLLSNALDDYVEVRDINQTLKEMNDIEKSILQFAYKSSDNFKEYKYALSKILNFRTYFEVVKQEDIYQNQLSLIADFENIKNRIASLKQEQLEVSKKLCFEHNAKEYKLFFEQNAEESKNFLYQISKQQNLWPIRKTMQHYRDYLLRLFPCWLLSPETVSQILPLGREMFDLVIFDEASQVFIENTLPCIYRGKNVVVAGDSKQLRPSATFVKRYMGNEDIDEYDLSMQAALEVESLLDLATSRYASSNLTYHYRSQSEELINFSNYAFYNKQLQIAPNATKSKKEQPIERIKVDGRWIGTKNLIEAQKVVEILSKLLKDKKRTASIGIITFNSEQEAVIEDLIDELALKDSEFRDKLLLEQNRKQDGEDISLFVKNIENVQGDERDIIIFSVGYAQNEYGKVVAHFGSLSNEGGENRLNVAITRAKQKIYVVTSIEPEELNVDHTKNLGPKLFKQYLRYVRAVSNANKTETNLILESLLPEKKLVQKDLNKQMASELAQMLLELGYKIETNVGSSAHKLPIAILNKKKDKFVLGIEFDYSAFESSENILERDVYHPEFIKSRGWNILRIWSRDWWLNKKKVISQISKMLKKLDN